MKIFRVFAFLMIVTTVLTLAWTTPPAGEDYSKAKREETVIFDIDGGRVVSPELWNPFVPGARLDNGYHQAILEPLFILNYSTGKMDPWLGETFTSNDKMDEWTLKLRKGITWSDGKPFTADDVVFTIEMLKKTPGMGYNSDMNAWVQEVKKVDDLTAVFKLKKPNPRFQLEWFSIKTSGSLNIMPKHIWENQDPLKFKFYDKEKGYPVGTGPYKLFSANETEFVYVRDDNWWGVKAGFKKALPQPKKLIWMWGGPEETRTALMADSKLDSLMDITLGAFQALKAKNPRVITWQEKPPYTWYGACPRTLEFNTTVKPWDDKDMRWAVNMIIDRERIVKIAYEGTSTPGDLPFPAYTALLKYSTMMKGKGRFDELWKVNVAGAQKIFESKGYTKKGAYYVDKNGKELAFAIETNEAFIEKQRIADQLVEMFQSAGLNVTHRKLAGGTWSENLAFGKFEVRMGWQHCNSVNEPYGSLNTLNRSYIKPVGERADNNGWRWDNKEFSDLVDQMSTLPLGDPKVDDLTIKALTIYIDEMPSIVISQAKKLIPFDTTYWTNWPDLNKNYYIHGTTWWQSTHVILHNLQQVKK